MEELECPICMTTDHKPMILPCTHCLCEGCEKGMKNKKCPVCDKDYKPDQVLFNRPLYNVIMKMRTIEKTIPDPVYGTYEISKETGKLVKVEKKEEKVEIVNIVEKKKEEKVEKKEDKVEKKEDKVEKKEDKSQERDEFNPIDVSIDDCPYEIRKFRGFEILLQHREVSIKWEDYCKSSRYISYAKDKKGESYVYTYKNNELIYVDTINDYLLSFPFILCITDVGMSVLENKLEILSNKTYQKPNLNPKPINWNQNKVNINLLRKND